MEEEKKNGHPAETQASAADVKEWIRRGGFLAVAAAFFIVPWVCAPVRDYAPGVAVIAGVIFAVTWGNPFSAMTGKLTSPLLGAAIVGMGFGMNLIDVLHAGANGILYTAIGITLGIGHIREARRVVLQVSGSHKAQIVRRIYETPATDAVPATVMQLLPQGIVVLDEDAASQLDTVTRGGEGVTVC